MLPIIILAAVVVPLVVAAFLVMRRSRISGEHEPGEDEASRRRNEQEFAEAEAYQEEWRAEQHRHPDDRL